MASSSAAGDQGKKNILETPAAETQYYNQGIGDVSKYQNNDYGARFVENQGYIYSGTNGSIGGEGDDRQWGDYAAFVKPADGQTQQQSDPAQIMNPMAAQYLAALNTQQEGYNHQDEANFVQSFAVQQQPFLPYPYLTGFQPFANQLYSQFAYPFGHPFVDPQQFVGPDGQPQAYFTLPDGYAQGNAEGLDSEALQARGGELLMPMPAVTDPSLFPQLYHVGNALANMSLQDIQDHQLLQLQQQQLYQHQLLQLQQQQHQLRQQLLRAQQMQQQQQQQEQSPALEQEQGAESVSSPPPAHSQSPSTQPPRQSGQSPSQSGQSPAQESPSTKAREEQDLQIPSQQSTQQQAKPHQPKQSQKQQQQQQPQQQAPQHVPLPTSQQTQPQQSQAQQSPPQSQQAQQSQAKPKQPEGPKSWADILSAPAKPNPPPAKKTPPSNSSPTSTSTTSTSPPSGVAAGALVVVPKSKGTQPEGAANNKPKLVDKINPTNFDYNVASARFFVIKSYSEDDIHKSIKYNVWASTDSGNRRLDAAYRESAAFGPIYLFFSVNASGQFCGMAQMTSPLDYTTKCELWAQDKWNGQFTVHWIFVKDIPNANLRHIRLINNEGKPVTNSRDTQEVFLEPGREVLRIFSTYQSKTSILDDFGFYDKRQELMKEKKTLLEIESEENGNAKPENELLPLATGESRKQRTFQNKPPSPQPPQTSFSNSTATAVKFPQTGSPSSPNNVKSPNGTSTAMNNKTGLPPQRGNAGTAPKGKR